MVGGAPDAIGAEARRAEATIASGNPRSANCHRPTGERSKRQLTEQAELAYQRLIQDWQATAISRNGAGAALGRASQRPSIGTAARQGPAPEPAL